MTQPLKNALALLFRRYREPPVSEEDLVKGMSLTLTWTKPSNAPNLLARGIQQGLLEHTEDGYTPCFDPTEADIPFGFEPPTELFEPVETPSDEPAQGHAASPALEEEPDTDKEEPSEESRGWDEAPILETLVARIAQHQGEDDRRTAIAAVNAKQERLDSLVTLPAAALIVAREHGLDTTEESQGILEQLRHEA